MIKSYISNSPKETVEFAKDLAKNLKPNTVIAFKGGLGVGKTHFTKGIAEGLGYEGTVTSPTFALINEYTGGRLNIYHFDMYRINTWEDLYSSGFFEYKEAGGVTVIEWSENILSALDRNTVFVEIENMGETKRKITVRDEEK